MVISSTVSVAGISQSTHFLLLEVGTPEQRELANDLFIADHALQVDARPTCWYFQSRSSMSTRARV